MKRIYKHLPAWLDREIQMGEWIPVGHWIENANDKRPDIANFNPESMGQDGRSSKEIEEMARLCAAAPVMYAALMAMTTSFAASARVGDHTQLSTDYALNAMAIAVKEK